MPEHPPPPFFRDTTALDTLDNFQREPGEVSESEPRSSEREHYPALWMEVSFCSVALLLGFCHIWADRHYLLSADAMSYLDIADAYLRGDWQTAVNSYWGPLYSWLIALALLVIRPSPYWKFAVLHLVNFGIYLFALGCFRFLLHEIIQRHRSSDAELLNTKLTTVPAWAWLMLGYPLFIWTSLYLIGVHVESPDMLVASLLYLATGITLHIARYNSSWTPFIMLGIVLGLGWFAKSVMLPMAMVFLVMAMFSLGSLRQAFPRVFVASAIFILMLSPFVIATYRSTGRVTLGSSGTLNYLWVINRIPPRHWQGEEAGYGTAKHPTRKISDVPPIYEFGHPIAGTYPVWYDPAYWYEGSVRRFDFRYHLIALGRSVRRYHELFTTWGVQYAILGGLLSLYIMSGRQLRVVLQDIARQWRLLVPALVGIGLYALIAVQGRYVAPLVVLLWLALFSGIRLPSNRDAQRMIASTIVTLTTIITCAAFASSIREFNATARSVVVGEDESAHEQWRIAESLRQLGLAPDDRVAVIGNSFRAFWAHLAGLRIVAEIHSTGINDFWANDAAVKNQAMDAFRSTGAKAVVAESPPVGADMVGWQKLGNTHFYVYLLSE